MLNKIKKKSMKKKFSYLPICCNSSDLENSLPAMTSNVAKLIPAYSLG